MFRTLDYYDLLQKGNFTEQQAKATIKVISDVLEEHAVTRSDLLLAKQAVEHELKSLELRLIIKLGAMLTVSLALITSVLKLISNNN